ncbi:MAG: DUF4388 domain-containing protein [Myxococcota bacterium]
MAGWLRIEGDGVTVLDDETRERLAGRELCVLVAPGDLVVGIEADGGAEPAASLMLAGDLAHVAFPEVVSLIAHARATGVLRVSGASGTRRVIFGDGEVRGAASERVGERLNEIIVRMGLMKAEEMEQLCSENAEGHRHRVGRLAVERKLISERDLWNAIQEHVITIFQAILLESRGSFLLADETVVDAPTVPGLSAEGLLMEGVRRLDELRVAGPGVGRRGPDRVMAAFAGAFRDIFATAHEAGAGDALQGAARSVFEDDPSHADVFAGLSFGQSGDLPEGEIVARAARAAEREGREPEEFLSDVLSTVMLFLLFVAGEHLEPGVHQALHSRVKSIVSRG